MPPKIVVLGAGVVGLSTALQILDAIPGCDVTIIADKFLQDTTSNGAGGIVIPTFAYPGVPKDVVRKWAKDSFDQYDRLLNSEIGPEAGVFATTGYDLFKQKPTEEPLYAEIVYSCTECEEKESRHIPSRYKHVLKISTLMVECTRYLPYLTKLLTERGVHFIRKTVSSLEEFVGQCHILMNCSGLRSRELLSDDAVYPVRGQIMKIDAPWIKKFYHDGDRPLADTYIIPGINAVTIGGTRGAHDYRLEVDPSERRATIDRCSEIIPAIKHAKVLRDWVGLRPTRRTLRVEMEILHFQSGNITVIHNYGHGGNGVALSWGTSKDAVERARKHLLGSSSKL